MNEEVRRKAIVKFAHGAGPRQVAFELGITVQEAATVQSSAFGVRRMTPSRRRTPRRK